MLVSIDHLREHQRAFGEVPDILKGPQLRLNTGLVLFLEVVRFELVLERDQPLEPLEVHREDVRLQPALVADFDPLAVP